MRACVRRRRAPERRIEQECARHRHRASWPPRLHAGTCGVDPPRTAWVRVQSAPAADAARAQPMDRLASTPVRWGHEPSSVSSESARITWIRRPARSLGGSRRNDTSAKRPEERRGLPRALSCASPARAHVTSAPNRRSVARPRSATPRAACAARVHRRASSWAQTRAQRFQGKPSRLRRALRNRAAPSRHKGGTTGTAHGLRECAQPGVHKEWRTRRRERDRECEGGDLNPHGVTR